MREVNEVDPGIPLTMKPRDTDDEGNFMQKGGVGTLSQMMEAAEKLWYRSTPSKHPFTTTKVLMVWNHSKILRKKAQKWGVNRDKRGRLLERQSLVGVIEEKLAL